MLASTQSSALARLLDELPGKVQMGRTVCEPVRRLASGVAAIDALFDGGLPCGKISEIIGPASCGKTALLLMWLATATRRGEITACIDVAGALHPPSVAAAGADLRRLLWVRPPSAREAVRCAELILQAGGFGVVALDFGASPPRGLRANVWPRLMRAAELSHVPLVVFAPYRVAGSFSVLGLQLRQRRVVWRPGLWALLDGFELSAQLVRNKLGQTRAGSCHFAQGFEGATAQGFKGVASCDRPTGEPSAPALPSSSRTLEPSNP